MIVPWSLTALYPSTRTPLVVSVTSGKWRMVVDLVACRGALSVTGAPYSAAVISTMYYGFSLSKYISRKLAPGSPACSFIS